MTDLKEVSRTLPKIGPINVPTPPSTTVTTAFPETLKNISSGETKPLNIGYRAPDTAATTAAKINATCFGPFDLYPI